MKMIRTEEAADMLGLKPSTLKHWRCRPPKDGGPPYRRIGRLVKYEEAELREWARRQ